MADNPEMTIRFFGEILGALAGSYFFIWIAKRAIGNRLSPARSALLSFIIATVPVLGISSLTMGFVPGFILYGPCLLLWLAIGLLGARGKK